MKNPSGGYRPEPSGIENPVPPKNPSGLSYAMEECSGTTTGPVAPVEDAVIRVQGPRSVLTGCSGDLTCGCGQVTKFSMSFDPMPEHVRVSFRCRGCGEWT